MDGMYRRVARRWEEEGNSEISLEIISGFSILTRNREVVSWKDLVKIRSCRFRMAMIQA